MTLYLTASTAQKQNQNQGQVLVRPDFQTQPKQAGDFFLTPLNQQEKLNVINRLKNLISEISFSLGDTSGWIYSWTSTRDRHASSVLRHIELFHRIDQTLETSPGQDFQFTVLDPYLASALILHSQEKNFIIKYSFKTKLIWISQKLCVFHKSIRLLLSASLRWWRIVKAAKENPINSYSQGRRDSLIFSIFHNAPGLQTDGRIGDVYFGNLSTFLKNQGQDVLLCGYIFGDPTKISRSLGEPANTLTSFGHHLNYLDVFIALIKTVGSLMKALVFCSRHSMGAALTKLIVADLLTAPGVVLSSLLIEKATMRLLNKNPANRLFVIHENNPWELAVIRAARRAKPKIEVFGYIHCAILKSHLKHLLKSDQLANRPFPDKIICTGQNSRDLYEKVSDFTSDRIFAGSNLSGPLLADSNLRSATPIKVQTILAVFEGFPEMVGFVRFLAEVAKIVPDVRILIRPHPIQFGLKELIDKSGVNIEEGASLEPSKPTGLTEAISEADAIIYKGSTAAFFALHRGIPSIHYDDDWLISDDPLVECSALKWNVHTPMEIVKVIKEIEFMSNQDFNTLNTEARNYVKGYLSDPSPKSLEAFLN
jgi:hypothetical protein